MDTLTQKIHQEISKAQKFKHAGEDGKARVSARRAAGLAARRWLAEHSHHSTNITPYIALEIIKEFDYFPLPFRQALEELTEKVDINYKIPDDFDLIKSAQIIINYLEKGRLHARE